MNASQMAELLINCANQFSRAKNNSFGADGKYWELANRNWLTTIVEVLMARRGPALTLNELIRTKTEMSKLTTREVAKQWLTKNLALNLTEETRAAILEMSVIAENTRSCIFTSATQTIIFWGRPPLADLVNPQPNLPEVDLFSILEDGACVVATVAQPSWGSIMTPLVVAIKNHFAQVVLSRPKIEVIEDGKARKINQTRPVYLVIDEFHRYISASPDIGEVALLDMAREFRMGAILATQNLSSLQSVVGQTTTDLLLALCGTQVFLSNTDHRTATHASRILGTRKIRHEQRSVAPTLPPPLLIKESTRRNGDRSETDSRTSYYTEEPAMTSARLSKLKTGEFWVRLADGSVQHAQARDYEQ
jgi:type IV secretory pathway TraG/TraD family ATPase VirD4